MKSLRSIDKLDLNCLQKSSKFQKQLFVVLLYVFRKQSYSLWTNDGISDVHLENQNQTLRLNYNLNLVTYYRI